MKLKNKTVLALSIISILIAIILIVGLILTTQNKTENDRKEEQNKEENIENEEGQEEKKITIIDENSNSRNLAIMINNIKNVWGYQSGLQEAYIVYEMIVEGGFTRLLAVYKDQNLDRIGCVRSSRPYYLDYVLENDAIYVNFGGSTQALDEIKELKINNVDFLYSSGYWRDTSLNLSKEHTAFTSTEKIMEQIQKKKYRTTTESAPLLKYQADEVDLSTYEDSKKANKVEISFSNVRSTEFEYDSESKVYKRSQNNKEQTDYVTKKQYTAKNIIVYQVKNYTLPGGEGRQALENIGSGTGYYITNGYAREITWEKKSREAKTVYKYLNGEEIVLNDGNTHIEIQPKERSLKIN